MADFGAMNRGAHASAPQTRTHALPRTNRVHPNCTDSSGDGEAAHAGLKMSSLATAGGAPGKNPENAKNIEGFGNYSKTMQKRASRMIKC